LVTEKIAADIRAMADGGLSPTQVKALEAVTGRFDFSFDVQSVRHILTQHGSAGAELSRGQRAVVPGDYALLLQVLNSPDTVTFIGVGRTSAKPLVRFAKLISGQSIEAVFEARTGRKSLALVTLYVGASP
jgi:hypothetical protein